LASRVQFDFGCRLHHLDVPERVERPSERPEDDPVEAGAGRLTDAGAETAGRFTGGA
jgi:hypothetical protein